MNTPSALHRCKDHPDYHLDHKGWCWFADHYSSPYQEVPVQPVTELYPKAESETYKQPTLSETIFAQLQVKTITLTAKGDREMTMDDFNGTDWDLGEGDKLAVTGVKDGKVKVRLTVAQEVNDGE